MAPAHSEGLKLYLRIANIHEAGAMMRRASSGDDAHATVTERARTPSKIVALASLSRRAFDGIVWMMLQNVMGRGCLVLSQLGMAALLRPSDFGVIGLAYTITTIASTLTNVGIEDVLLRRRAALRYWTGPAFWISLCLSFLAGAIVLLAAPFAASLYKAPELIGLLTLSAVSIPIGALANVPGMILRARMQFRVLAISGAVENIAQAALTLGFAWLGFGAYSFVLPLPMLAVGKAAAWWRLAARGIALQVKVRRWRHLVGNTLYTFLNRILGTIIGQGDYFVLGLLATHDVVGAYYFGFRVAAQPLGLLTVNVMGVLYPALVHFKYDPVRQARAALMSCRIVLYSLIPLALLQAACAAPLITWLFGERWAASIPIIQLLSIGMALDSVSGVSSTLASARGEFKAVFLYTALETPVFFALVTVGALLDRAVGTAWGVCIFFATKPIFVYLVFRKSGVTPLQLAMIYVKPLILAAGAFGLGWAAAQFPVFAGWPMMQIVITSAIGLTLYFGMVCWRAPEIWAEFRARVMSRRA